MKTTMLDEPMQRPYAHRMLAEIYEQPDALSATLAQYANADGLLASCDPVRHWLADAGEEIVIVASGSSRHAGQLGELYLEDRGGIAVDVEYASEHIYRAEGALKKAAVLVISQSGETVDTLAALRRANCMGQATLAIMNNPRSCMAVEAHLSFPTDAGLERAVPATKSFTAQLLNLYLLSILAQQVRGRLDETELQVLLTKLRELPAAIARQLPAWDEAAASIALRLASATSFLFLGRGVHYPIAREAALKLKESAYLTAEGLPSGELKHGPNALVSDKIPLVMLATCDRTDAGSVERHAKMLQLMADMRAQGARILAVANVGDAEVEALASEVIWVEQAQEELLALTGIIPLQLFAYHMAIHRGIDVDRPRNLSKAVLVE